jgi:glycerophosphoryl diester phosphodiesterase
MLTVILCVVVAAVGCKQAVKQETQDMAARLRTRIVAHRGASYYAPENTEAAFKLAWEQQADAIEGDFYLTADGHIVCFHDRTSKRTAGVDLGIEDATLAQLRVLDVGAWKAPEYAGQRPPTLAEVLDMIPPGKMFYLEIKSGPHAVEPISKIVRQSGLRPEQIVVIAFNAEVIARTRELMPELKAYWLLSYKFNEETQAWSPSFDKILETLGRINAHGLSTHGNQKVVDENFVKKLRAAGYEFHVWTIDDAESAQYFYELGADSITTNRPGFIRDVLTENQK